MTASAELVPADLDEQAAAVERQVVEARSVAEALKVTNPEQEERAARILQEVKQRKKAALDLHKQLKEPVLEAGRRIDKVKNDTVAPLEEIEGVIKGKVGTYRAEIERQERAERERIEAEQRERERIAREAREKQEAEAEARRQKAIEDAEAARELAAEEDSEEAEQLAAEAEQQAHEADTAASAIAALPEPSLPMPVVKSAPKAKGIVTRKVWKVKSITPRLLPPEYLIPDEKAIDAAMRDGVRENGQPPTIPGVCFEQVPELAVRS